MDEAEIVYVGDPMCSWCWGFAPVLASLRERYASHAWRLLVGGLRPGVDQADQVDETMKAYLRKHWRAVKMRTGQPFDFAFFEREDFMYDTEPPCRAVVVLGAMDEGKEWSFFHTIQEAFYAKNQDVTNLESLAYLAGEWLEQVSIFSEHMKNEAWQRKTYAQFQEARDLGIRSFPSLLVKKGNLVMPVTVGYQAMEGIIPRLDEALTALA